MNESFLDYSAPRELILDKWIRNAIGLHIRLNLPTMIFDDDFELEYKVDFSMREWGLFRTNTNHRTNSPWAVFDPTGKFVIDSIMRDQHVVSIHPAEQHDCIKVSLDIPSREIERSKLYSLSTFSQIEAVRDIATNRAISQVRWLRIRSIMCEGVFVSDRRLSHVFIPLLVNPWLSKEFSLGAAYTLDRLFEFFRNDSGEFPS
jgi:hypothetical protein